MAKIENARPDGISRDRLPGLGAVIAVALCALASPGKAEGPSISGRWLTMDDRTGAPRGIVRLEEKDGELAGFIERGLPRPGEAPDPPNCDRCPGDLRGRPIAGLRFLWGFRWSGAEWISGNILDPDDGNIYSGAIRLSDDGNSLSVRGYVGLRLFGRTQTWKRHLP